PRLRSRSERASSLTSLWTTSAGAGNARERNHRARAYHLALCSMMAAARSRRRGDRVADMDARLDLGRTACRAAAPPTCGAVRVLTGKPSINGRRVTVGHRSRPCVTRLLTAMARRGLHTMLTLGQAARLGTITKTGPAVRHATPEVTDAELRYRVRRVQESLTELKSGLEEMRSQRDAWEAR